MSQKIISCATHDFIEIACTFGYSVRLDLFSGETIQGQAITTQISRDKKESLVIKSHQHNQTIELITIKTMKALQSNPHFDTVSF